MVIWRTHTAVDVASWYGATAQGTWQPSLAGWWFGCVSLPLFQFILLRWYFRLFIWARFLWHVSRIELKLVPTHPDRCGGLGFLASVSAAFAPVAAGPGRSDGGDDCKPDFFRRGETAAVQGGNHRLVAVMLFAVFGPLLVFIPVLGRAKRAGLREYGVAGPTLRARLRSEMAAGRRAGRGTVGRKRRHPIAGRPGQQLRGRARHEIGARHQGSRLSTRGAYTSAPAAVDADDVFARSNCSSGCWG